MSKKYPYGNKIEGTAKQNPHESLILGERLTTLHEFKLF